MLQQKNKQTWQILHPPPSSNAAVFNAKTRRSRTLAQPRTPTRENTRPHIHKTHRKNEQKGKYSSSRECVVVVVGASSLQPDPTCLVVSLHSIFRTFFLLFFAFFLFVFFSFFFLCASFWALASIVLPSASTLLPSRRDRRTSVQKKKSPRPKKGQASSNLRPVISTPP